MRNRSITILLTGSADQNSSSGALRYSSFARVRRIDRFFSDKKILSEIKLLT